MALYRKQGGGNVTASVQRRSGGSWATPAAIRRRLGTTWVNAWSAINVAVSNINMPVFRNEPAPVTMKITAYPAPTVTGSSSYSVYWSRVSGSTAITCSNASALSPQFAATLYRNTEQQAVWRITVTDTASGMSASADIYIYFAYWTDL